MTPRAIAGLIGMFIAAVLVTGCADLSDRWNSHGFADDRSDDEYCVKQGLRYPDTAYVGCRRSLQNTRLLHVWQSEQMRQAGGGTGNPAVDRPIAPPTGGFQPLDAEHFQCQAVTEYGAKVIACAETLSPPRQ